MPTLLEHFQRIDTKLGTIDDELASKLGIPADGGTFNPAAIDLTQGQIEYNAYTQTGAIAFALAGTPAIGGMVTVNIRGGGFAVTFPGNFIGLEGLTSGTVLENGVNYPFYFRSGIDWVETSPGVFEDRVLVGALGLDHAASHVTGGTDKIRDATASQDGLATAAQITKLDGIAAGAGQAGSVSETTLASATLAMLAQRHLGLGALDGFTLVRTAGLPYGLTPQTVGADVVSLALGGSSPAVLTPQDATTGEIIVSTDGGIRFNTTLSRAEMLASGQALPSDYVTVVAAFWVISHGANSPHIWTVRNDTNGHGVALRFDATNIAFQAYTAPAVPTQVFATPWVAGLNVIALSYRRSTGAYAWAKNSAPFYGSGTGAVGVDWTGLTNLSVEIGHASASYTANWEMLGADESTSSALATREQLEALVREMAQRRGPSRLRTLDLPLPTVAGGAVPWSAIPLDDFYQYEDVDLAALADSDPIEPELAPGTRHGAGGGRVVVTGNGNSISWGVGFRSSNPGKPLSTVLAVGSVYSFVWWWNVEEEVCEVNEDGPGSGVAAHATSHISGSDQLPVATTSVKGLMSAADKTAVDGALQSSGGTMTGQLTVVGVRVATGSAVTGALTMAAHGGGVFVTSGNVTVPNTAGFSVTLIAGGAHTVGAGGAAHSLASGDIVSVVCFATGNVKLTKVLAANVVSLPTS